MTGDQLNHRLDCYLALERAMGLPMQAQELMLRSYVRFVIEKGEPCDLSAQLALDWALAASSRCGQSGHAARLNVARRFLAHLSAISPEVEIPPKGLLSRPPRPKPFLFCADQIKNLINAAAILGPKDSLRPYTISTLFGLLASTGLRPSEALKLTIADVQLHRQFPQLHIRETKFHKSRLVPLHATTAARLDEYADRRRRLKYDGLTDAFLVSEQGKPVHYMALYRTFHRLLDLLQIGTQDGCRTPSLNTFRHGFAVDRLRIWCQEGIDVRAWLPRLSVYMGHIDPINTYWYLTATPDLLLVASESFASYFKTGGTQ
jgi:integrase/recombinase XerD